MLNSQEMKKSRERWEILEYFYKFRFKKLILKLLIAKIKIATIVIKPMHIYIFSFLVRIQKITDLFSIPTYIKKNLD